MRSNYPTRSWTCHWHDSALKRIPSLFDSPNTSHSKVSDISSFSGADPAANSSSSITDFIRGTVPSAHGRGPRNGLHTQLGPAGIPGHGLCATGRQSRCGRRGGHFLRGSRARGGAAMRVSLLVLAGGSRDLSHLCCGMAPKP